MARENIPGLSITYKEGGLLVPVIEGSLTDTVLVIGTAVDGPSGEPVRINLSSAETLFGPLIYDTYYTPYTSTGLTVGNYNGNSLLKGLNEVVQGGATDIILMRVGGTTASYPCTAGGNNFKLNAIYPGRIYNNLACALASATATLTVHQSSIGKGNTLTYTLSGKTLTQLMNEINTDVNNRSIRVTTTNSTGLNQQITTASLNVTSFTLSAGTGSTTGTNGTVEEEYALGGSLGLSGLVTELCKELGAFDILQDLDADIVFVSGIYADDSATGANTESLATRLASACFISSLNGFPKFGVMGLRPIYTNDRTSINTKVNNLISSSAAWQDEGRKILSMGYFMGATETGASKFVATDPNTNITVDTGRYIQLVAGPDVILSQNQLGAYVDSPAGAYAGLISTLSPQRATTNKQIPGIGGVTYDFTVKQVNKLAGGQPYDNTVGAERSGYGGAYVVLRKDYRGLTVVNQDNTCALRRSDYSRLQVLRIVDAVIEGIREITLPYIGEPNHFSTRMAIRNSIRNYLDSVAETKAIAGGENIGYSFSVTSTTADIVLGRLVIELTLRPALQIRSINVTVSVAPPIGD